MNEINLYNDVIVPIGNYMFKGIVIEKRDARVKVQYKNQQGDIYNNWFLIKNVKRSN